MGKLVIAELRDYVNSHPDAKRSEIATHFNRDEAYLSRLFKKHGINYTQKSGRRQTHILPPDRLKLYVREHPKATQKDIAEHFGCSIMTVSKAVKAHNIAYKRKRAPRQIQL